MRIPFSCCAPRCKQQQQRLVELVVVETCCQGYSVNHKNQQKNEAFVNARLHPGLATTVAIQVRDAFVFISPKEPEQGLCRRLIVTHLTLLNNGRITSHEKKKNDRSRDNHWLDHFRTLHFEQKLEYEGF